MAGPTVIMPVEKGGKAEARKGLAFLFRALDSRNYRLFFSGQLVSLIGTWLTNVATSWLVNRITDSPRMLGLINFTAMLPAFFLAPFAGVMVDRWNKRRLLMWTQGLSMAESFGLAALAFAVAGHGRAVTPETVTVVVAGLFVMATFQGLINAFDVPARQSFVIDLVERRDDLPNAIALNSSMFNMARLLGPAVAGFLIYTVGEGWCFTLDGISYIAVLIALWMMRVAPSTKAKSDKKVLVDLKAGFKYAAGMCSIRSILLLLAVGSFAGTPQMILMPRFATVVLHGDSRTQGFLTAAVAAGALMGAMRLAGRKSVVGLGRVMPMAAAGMGVGLILFGLSTHLLLSAASLVVVGFCTMTMMAAGNTLLQTIVTDDMRGRVMSLFTMAFMGMMPIGSLLSGMLAEPKLLGPQWTTMAGGVVAIFGAAAFATRLPAIRREVRPIYVGKGILPAASGLQAVEQVVEESER